mmetsp:Transcript_71808/g.186475  ORF Transcript_71808/g.186475 Transcript_71808/m.186475 type:complete len:206 (+) Transcript_71808:3-620(+)
MEVLIQGLLTLGQVLWHADYKLDEFSVEDLGVVFSLVDGGDPLAFPSLQESLRPGLEHSVAAEVCQDRHHRRGTQAQHHPRKQQVRQCGEQVLVLKGKRQIHGRVVLYVDRQLTSLHDEESRQQPLHLLENARARSVHQGPHLLLCWHVLCLHIQDEDALLQWLGHTADQISELVELIVGLIHPSPQLGLLSAGQCLAASAECIA